MKIPAFVGGSYTAASNVIADEECLNFYAETIETEGAQTKRAYIGTPGLLTFVALPESPVRGSCEINGRCFEVGGSKLYEVFTNQTYLELATIGTDGKQVSIVASNLEIFIVSAGRAYDYTLATNAIVEVTGLLAGIPIKGEYSDGYFIVIFQDSNKFQTSDLFDGTTWPGLQVDAVSVFPENLSSLIVSRRELWIFGSRHIQPYQHDESDEIFNVVPGTSIEKGCGPTFGPCRVDNSIFWVDEDERGARMCWRASGYTPQRISTHAVETAMAALPSIANLASYSYQEAGHLFWMLYIPGTDFSWCYDVGENLWHKRASWDAGTATFSAHTSWNHVYVFGKHLVGDWNSGKIYEMSADYLDDDGRAIRRVRRSPTMVQEMKYLYYSQIVLDFAPGLTPQPPFVDGDGNDRPAQAMLRWSDNRGSTWKPEHILDCGFAGEYNKRIVLWRLGRSRYRVWEISVSDPIRWYLVDCYVEVDPQDGR